MTEEEKYLFDLQGYLVLENAIDAETVDRMNAWIDMQARNDERWRAQIRNVQIASPITWGPDFLALLDAPRALAILKAVLGPSMRLDHDYAIFLSEGGHRGMELHGPSLIHPYDPIHFYHQIEGRIFCGLTVASYALTDSPPGSGGLAVVPGSHKQRFRIPEDIRLLERESPIVQHVPMKKGDCVIFTESLVHGTLPWKGPGERRTLFFKYGPGGVSWSDHAYFPQKQMEGARELEPLLSPAQRKLLMPPCADDFRR
jgi:ectoine hydroxylase-related dioxygenase (phytanoyl-CoA dioxygenase family)